MDRFDRQILDALQQDCRRTFDDLSEAIGLSPSAIRRRVQALRKSGVILKDVSLLDPAKLGITVIISIRFEKESQATYDAFKKSMRAKPEVSQCYTVSGEVDFIVIAHFATLEIYDDWVNEVLLTNNAIARSTTNIVYSRVKFDTSISVEPDQT